jgi:lipopolysaccharide transport system ATP-binding protein
VGIYLADHAGRVCLQLFRYRCAGQFERFSVRPAGHYKSRCQIPANLLNEGRFILGMNASSFRIKRYFHDEHALAFNIDGTGAPGKHWLEPRLGPLRPALDWVIEKSEAYLL